MILTILTALIIFILFLFIVIIIDSYIQNRIIDNMFDEIERREIIIAREREQILQKIWEDNNKEYKLMPCGKKGGKKK